MANQWIQAGIQFKMRMHWVARSQSLELHMLTALHENGSRRKRLCHTTDSIEAAFQMSVEILEQGGILDVDALLDETYWQFGWQPELAALRDRMNDLARQQSHTQCDWFGFSDWQKSRRRKQPSTRNQPPASMVDYLVTNF